MLPLSLVLPTPDMAPLSHAAFVCPRRVGHSAFGATCLVLSRLSLPCRDRWHAPALDAVHERRAA
eukprot:920106-Pleurochrysis_carterae.AAC.1